jgi:pyruvate dehydrogenase (quinone)
MSPWQPSTSYVAPVSAVFKVVVFNNNVLRFVELEMKAAGLINFGTGLQNPNFAALAAALGTRRARFCRGGATSS